MEELFVKLVPHSLTIQQKLTPKPISQYHLNFFDENKPDFITVDGSLIYNHDTKLKQD